MYDYDRHTDRDDRRRDRRSRRDRRDIDRDHRDRDRDHDDMSGDMASRFQSLDEVIGQVSAALMCLICAAEGLTPIAGEI